jgi:hypothetical protein
MNRYQYKSANRHKALLLSLILPITLLVILGLAARPGSAENEATFTTYLPNVGNKYSSSPDRMLAAVSSDDVGNPVPPVIESITTESAEPLVSVNSPIDFTSVFTDPSLINDSFTAYWEWGDGSFTTQYDVVSPIQASHVYTEPNIYTIALIVADSDGLSDTASFEYLVVYDPSGGFVSGGGWIDSPDGAYLPDPSISGKATFGFVSKYKKGATVPTGNTEFQFKVAGLNFHSNTFDWLVINQGSSNAQFKGTGTINGGLAPNGELYKFMIWASDGDPDAFRIKIWYEENNVEVTVYDNGIEQAISGGSIVVHKGK